MDSFIMKRSCLLFLVFLIFSQVATAQRVALQATKVKKGQLQETLSYKHQRTPIISAHRGGRFIKGYPENAIETFEYTITRVPAMIECDIEITQDSVLILMHDNTLERTTTGKGKVKEQSWSYIKTLHLKDDFGDSTNFKVPTLTEVLVWGKKTAILELDVKRGVPFEKVVDAVEAAKMEDYVIIITYNSKDAQKVYELNPRLMISVTIRNEEEFQRIKDTKIPFSNLIVFTGTTLPDATLYEKIHAQGSLAILGTMGNIDNSAKVRGSKVYQNCIATGVNVLATDYPWKLHKH
ncbi:MAG: glycerophosphodiester phosphodiesterase family protein [Saprospiraceae bacterium]|nr:glycerophosphodiester phosphodiesterase family protein [Saprospiraceae bacterium]